MGLAKWQVFWEYFGGRRVFHVPRICGRQTFWFNGAVYSRELFGRHKYRCARFSLASSETGFIPPSPSLPVLYIAVRQEEISRNSFRKVPCPLGCRGKFYFKSALEHSPLTMEYFSRSVVLFENKGFEFRVFRVTILLVILNPTLCDIEQFEKSWKKWFESRFSNPRAKRANSRVIEGN